MPVLMIAEIPNLTEEVYAQMVGERRARMQAHQGFIAHTGGPNPGGGWRVVEVWETEADVRKWFDENVKPDLPPDILPDRKYYPLHTAFTRDT